jgi:hypothetical protein
VNAYSNHIPCYIPSTQVLAEGGYEAEKAMDFYGLHAVAPDVEDRIVGTVRALLPAAFTERRVKLKREGAKSPRASDSGMALGLSPPPAFLAFLCVSLVFALGSNPRGPQGARTTSMIVPPSLALRRWSHAAPSSSGATVSIIGFTFDHAARDQVEAERGIRPRWSTIRAGCSSLVTTACSGKSGGFRREVADEERIALRGRRSESSASVEGGADPDDLEREIGAAGPR